MSSLKPTVHVQVLPTVSEELDQQWLLRAAEVALRYENPDTEAEIGLVITDDDGIRDLNRRFRRIDAPTDVLAFSTHEAGEFVLPSELPPYLGDIIISYPRAAEQAAQMGHSTDRELAVLVIHGVLHLLGYDHDEEANRARMWAAQDLILQQLGP